MKNQIEHIIKNVDNFKKAAEISQIIASWAIVISTTETKELKEIGVKEIKKLSTQLNNLHVI